MEEILVDPAADRHILDFRPLGFSDVAVLGRYVYTSAHQPLVWHTHGNMIEICLMESGHQNYIVEGKEYSLVGGDIFLTRPHEKHGSGSYPEEKGVLYWLLIHIPKSRRRFLSLPPAQGKCIVQQLLSDCPRQFKGTAKLKNTLNQVFTVFHESTDSLRIVNLQNLLLRFLLDILACAAQQKEKGPSPEILHILSFINQHLCEMIPLGALADEINLSLSRFKMRFKKELGIPPAQYIMQRKIEKSKQLLSSDRYSVTDVAMQLGFSTSQYFAAVFKQYTGITPSQFNKTS
jgi:AraC-like DNA-binding protein/quercetin dioxygenase-like cupin family protein